VIEVIGDWLSTPATNGMILAAMMVITTRIAWENRDKDK
jgi:hypothetical protein